MFDLNKKKKNNFYLFHLVFKWFLCLGKNLKLVTTIRRLVGTRGSLSNMNLKYHVLILMQGLYSNSIMCLVVKPQAFPLVEWLFSYVVY